MISPYDWQQSVAQRAQYIETRLRGGSPIVALGIAEGTLVYTYRRQVRKVYEVYDCLMFSAMGQQADVE
ncbi:MAG: 20S proteasome subunit A/B, partial [Armatimonadota bacterium]|nr:20S proteasome subunit A/B [Armatimonadota bacterium]